MSGAESGILTKDLFDQITPKVAITSLYQAFNVSIFCTVCNDFENLESSVVSATLGLIINIHKYDTKADNGIKMMYTEQDREVHMTAVDKITKDSASLFSRTNEGKMINSRPMTIMHRHNYDTLFTQNALFVGSFIEFAFRDFQELTGYVYNLFYLSQRCHILSTSNEIKNRNEHFWRRKSGYV